jgi:hypothetical protein
MNIIEFTEKFQKMEVENKFFNFKDSNGVAYWDLVRYHIFMLIYKSLTEVKLIEPRKKKSFHKLGGGIRIFFNYLKFLYTLNFKGFKYLFFVSSKHIDNQGFNRDLISNDILSITKNDTLIIETFRRERAKYYYDSYFETGKFLSLNFKRILSRKKGIEKYSCSQIIKSIFEFSYDFDRLIYNLIWNYNHELQYYKRFLKKVNPSYIFMVQNGIQKGLFAAANKLNIPIVELQHGLIGPNHPAYSYPTSITELQTLPKYLFSFSDFWVKNINYPVDRIITIGNDHYYQKIERSKIEYGLTVIFGEAVAVDLINFINALLNNGFSQAICIKLHPNQIEKSERIKEQYSSFNNIRIISNEKTLNEVLAVSKSILAVQSTCVYEALHNEVKVFLLKIKGYQAHIDIFDNPNTYLIDEPTELIKLIDEEFIKDKTEVYFEKFNKQKFLGFINSSEN